MPRSNKRTKTKSKSPAKSAKPKKDGPKGAPKSVAAPKIRRKRGKSRDAIQEYITSAQENFAAKLAYIDHLKEEKKVPHRVVQYISFIVKEFDYLGERAVSMTKVPRKRNNENNHLLKPCTPSKELAKFLKLGKNEVVSRSDCVTAISLYVNVKDVPEEENTKDRQKWIKRMNPKGRCLQDDEDRSIIHPDAALSKLLGYEEYKTQVEAGEKVWSRKDKQTGEKYDVVEDDPSLRYYVIQHLIAPHFE